MPDHRNPFRFDFIHLDTKVAVEISGGVHSIQSIRKRDYMRNRWCLDNGYAVYTFCTSDLTKKEIDKHCEQVYNAIQRRLK